MKLSKIRAFLKWPGGKYRLIDRIVSALPKGDKLIEPFTGSGVVFLNTDYKRYLLNDINPDVIMIYKLLKQAPETFIQQCKSFFTRKNNTAEKYYQLRHEFNTLGYGPKRAAVFLYLNRHGYNGLCRYNLKGGYNVPFGSYKAPYFPEEQMYYFAQKAKRATFVCEDFTKTLKRARHNHVVYCDPPYLPLTQTARFTQYQQAPFGLKEQIRLSEMAQQLAGDDIPVLISNHNTAFAKKIYAKARQKETFFVSRFISCKSKKRKPASEILALFD